MTSTPISELPRGWSPSTSSDATVLGLRLAGALRVFRFRRGYLSVGSRWLQQASAANGDGPAHLRAKVLTSEGSIARLAGEFARADTLLEACWVIYRELNDSEGVAWALNHLGLVKQWLGHIDLGVQMLEESLALQVP